MSAIPFVRVHYFMDFTIKITTDPTRKLLLPGDESETGANVKCIEAVTVWASVVDVKRVF
jgi:hypothetical protein